jgi:hypothetical protein
LGNCRRREDKEERRGLGEGVSFWMKYFLQDLKEEEENWENGSFWKLS